jgi:hypothetical protein
MYFLFKVSAKKGVKLNENNVALIPVKRGEA